MKNKTPRAICLEILNRVERSDRHPDDLLTDSFKRYRHLTPLDRAFLTELTYGTLRWRGKLEWVIGKFSKIPLEKIEPEITHVLRVGLYQLLFLTRTPASAAVNEAVEAAKKTRGRGGGGFVNAVLREVIRKKEQIPYPDQEKDPALYIAVLQSHPLWLVRRWLPELGADETAKVCEFNQEIAPLVLRTNSLKISRPDLMGKFSEAGLKPFVTAFSDEGIVLRDPPPVSELPFFKEGLYIIQDEASQLVTSLLDPKPGETILDACAAPGGKTTHIGQQMRNEGSIYAVDVTKERLSLVDEASHRLGVTIIKNIQGDARRPLKVPEGLKFDRILADVPCSGFGTLRKNPDLKWRRGEEDIRRMGELQSSILANLAEYLKPGGILVYSTCTVFREENEEVVESFLKAYPEFSVVPAKEALPERLQAFAGGRYFKTFPLTNKMDGFFAARLVRRTA